MSIADASLLLNSEIDENNPGTSHGREALKGAITRLAQSIYGDAAAQVLQHASDVPPHHDNLRAIMDSRTLRERLVDMFLTHEHD